MNAAEAIGAARAAGIRITVDGDDLVLQASAPPSKDVLELLSRNKAGIVKMLAEAEKHRDHRGHATGEALPDPEELRRLVRLAGEIYGFTETEHSLALEIALADPVNALICFRGIAARIGSGW